MTEYRRAKWEGVNKISIQLDDIAEKWLLYYWPLLENHEFIPQQRGESPASQKKILFRNDLLNLIKHYKGKGGINRFVLDYRESKMDIPGIKLKKKAHLKIKTAIQKGPVVYAGGSLETGRIFDYDPKTKRILFSADIWRELVLMGHWIRDALVLRWAELTSEISRRNFKPSEIIDLLLINPLPEREVYDARNLYEKVSGKECVWSGKNLIKKFEVDHAIPFSLWNNNDLWNLFPVDPIINNKKRDKLPTRDLIKWRKDLIIDYWKLMYKGMTRRFDYEMTRFTCMIEADKGNWENKLFTHFREAVEYTAVQRGCERWEP